MCLCYNNNNNKNKGNLYSALHSQCKQGEQQTSAAYHYKTERLPNYGIQVKQNTTNIIPVLFSKDNLLYFFFEFSFYVN